MEWVKVLDASKLRTGLPEVVQVGDNEVMLLTHESRVYACGSVCPHMGLPLQLARIDAENALRCPWHRSAFDLETGDVKEWAPWPPGLGPMLGKTKRQNALPIYKTKVEDGAIWIQVKNNE